MKHGEFNSGLLVPDESGCSFKGCQCIAEVNGFGVAKDQVVEIGGMDAAAEVCRHHLKIFAVTDQGRRISHAIEPDARGCGGLDIGALRFSDLWICPSQQLDKREFAAAAHKPGKPVGDGLVEHRVIENEIIVAREQDAAAHILRG